MKLISVHFLIEEPKALFFFSSETRVDFRELVKDLVYVFKMRIELRQIGVRDESRITGGLGVCGRPYCCHAISDKLPPVSIKMAKEQNLSLNSMKISGQCGRLLCCLSYEYGWYAEARKKLPNEGLHLAYDGVNFKITDGATIEPANGSIQDFTNGAVVYTVTSEDGEWKRKYNVTFQEAPLPAQKYSFENVETRTEKTMLGGVNEMHIFYEKSATGEPLVIRVRRSPRTEPSPRSFPSTPRPTAKRGMAFV